MTLKGIIEKCSLLRVHEERIITDKYVEIIFYNEELDKWYKIFVDILGLPLSPAGVKPTQDDLNLTEDYGGISDRQTLFKKDFGDAIVIVMFWPWEDQTHITLKMVLLLRGREK